MRPLIAAVAGGVAGAAAAVLVLALRAPPPVATDDTAARAVAQLGERLDRLERSAAQHPRVAPVAQVAATEPPAAAGGDVPDWGGRGPRDAPSLPDTSVDVSKVATADLSLEADERWTRNEDVAGAAKRYRELLSRGGTPSERRHWLIRLGDCYVRLQHEDEAAQAYRDCVDASTEDHPERVACMIALARREERANAGEAVRWADRALVLESGRSNVDVHLLAWELAHSMKQVDREIRELEWLTKSAPYRLDSWSVRLAELRGEKR